MAYKRKKLVLGDLPPCTAGDDPTLNFETFHAHLNRADGNKNIIASLWFCFNKTFMFAGFMLLLQNLASFGSPIFVEKLLDFMSESDTSTQNYGTG